MFIGLGLNPAAVRAAPSAAQQAQTAAQSGKVVANEFLGDGVVKDRRREAVNKFMGGKVAQKKVEKKETQVAKKGKA